MLEKNEENLYDSDSISIADNPDEIYYQDIDSSYNSNQSIKYHYLCKECKTFPNITYFDKEKIKWCCREEECINHNKEILIKDIYNYITPKKNNIINLKCKKHNRQYDLYCEKCKKIDAIFVKAIAIIKVII